MSHNTAEVEVCHFCATGETPKKYIKIKRRTTNNVLAKKITSTFSINIINNIHYCSSHLSHWLVLCQFILLLQDLALFLLSFFVYNFHTGFPSTVLLVG